MITKQEKMQTNSPSTWQVWSALTGVSGIRSSVFDEPWTCLTMHTNIPQTMGKSWHLGVCGKVLLGIKTSFEKHDSMYEVTYRSESLAGGVGFFS